MKPRGEAVTLNGFLDKGSFFKGELTFEETFRIDGQFEGKISAGSELIVGDSAEVDAEIRVQRVSINGAVKGTVHASERIELHPRARVTAELHAPVLKIEEGAFFHGACSMTGDPQPRLVEAAATPSRK